MNTLQTNSNLVFKNKILALLIFSLVSTYFISCRNGAPAPANENSNFNRTNHTYKGDCKNYSKEEKIEYNFFKKDCVLLQPDQINHLSINNEFLVELNEIPSSGYIWSYEILNISGIELVDDRVFGFFNKSGNIGGSKNHLWKFKAGKLETGSIIFRKNRQWLGKDSAIESIEFKLYINKNY